MILIKNTLYVLKIGFISLFKNSSGYKDGFVANVIIFAIVPILIGILSYFNGFFINNDLISDILTIISIFLAITLGVIFIVPEKLAKRLDMDNSKNESDQYNRKRYTNFCKLFIQRLSFVLILCVFMIMSTYMIKIFPVTIKCIISSLVLTLFSLSLFCILKLVVDIYIFLISDIDNLNNT